MRLKNKRSITMLKKLQKSDYWFIIAMFAGLIMHLSCIYGADHFVDETFFPTVPLRLINGDSLVQDEWHLTQFSSLFLYLPVRIWMAVKGSTDGIILYLRYFYLIIHTLTATGIYTYFRKYKIWAVAAALMFYTQVPLRFMSANYHSLFALFLLLFTITLLTIYKKDNIFLYLFAGFCYGCCCVCNPLCCLLFLVYLISCIFQNYIKKRKNTKEKSLLEAELKCEILNKYFSGKAILKFSAGLAVAAIICITFFLATGGTISSLFENIPFLLADANHDIFSSPIDALWARFRTTIDVFFDISFNMPFLLPALYIALLLDKNRTKNNHRLVYISISLILAVFYAIGITICAINSIYAFALSLPFIIISSVCYILTENKDKKLFYCIWLPGAIFTIAQYFASALQLSVFWVLAVSNIAGVFFVKNFLEEILTINQSKKAKSKAKKHKSFGTICKIILCIGICLQIGFQGFTYSLGRTVDITEYTKLNKGPYAGFYLEESRYDLNISMMNDLDIIKERSSPDDNVLILSSFTWMYLYIDRPFATYTAWQARFEYERLVDYYEVNPDKKPKYIYVGWIGIPGSLSGGYSYIPELARIKANSMMQLFDCEQEELSCGILLTVKD